jgi:parvulin-like peptidyl-prolyl isomerase
VRYVRLFLVAVLVAAVAAGCGSTKKTVAPGGSVAKVGNETVTTARLDSLLASAKAYYASQKQTFPKQGTSAYKTLRDHAVAYLVQSAVFEQQAHTMGIDVSGKQVDTAIAKVKKQTFGGNEKKFEAGLKAQGLSMSELRAQEQLALTEAALRTKVTKGATVSDADARAYYKSHASSYKTAATRSVRHILVAKKTLAQTLYTKLQNGASFATLARKYSTDTGSKASGGKLTDTKGTFVPQFEAVAFKLKTNEISKPVHSQFGWHIIQALGPIHPPSVKPYSQVASSIKQQLLQKEQSNALTAFTKTTYKSFCAGKIAYGNGYKPSGSADPCASASSTTSTSTTG